MTTAHRPPATADAEPGFVSTGRLPGANVVGEILEEAHRRFVGVDDGSVSTVYPALARAPADLFGICVVSAAGEIRAAGDAGHPFTIMSVAKPFVFALACAAIGPEAVREAVGMNATGLAFNSAYAVERSADGRTNPMVNPGAIATAALIPGGTATARWGAIHDGLSRFAGHDLRLNDEVYASASDTNFRNRALANLLKGAGRLAIDPAEAVDVYTKQSCIEVTARDLAVMGATLAGGGRNPLTGEQVVDAAVCHYTLAVMLTAGLYETSGDWLYEVGLPGKSGIGGGIVTVSPGKGGLGTFAPRLDAAGNSVRGQLVARFLSRRLGLDLLASAAG